MRAYEIQTTLDAFQSLSEEIAKWAHEKGFWPEYGIATLTTETRTALINMEKTQKIMLVVTELAELTEGLRKKADSSTAGFTNEEEEVADAIIRLLDYAGHYRLRIGEALSAKMIRNEGRPYQHGKAF